MTLTAQRRGCSMRWPPATMRKSQRRQTTSPAFNVGPDASASGRTRSGSGLVDAPGRFRRRPGPGRPSSASSPLSPLPGQSAAPPDRCSRRIRIQRECRLVAMRKLERELKDSAPGLFPKAGLPDLGEQGVILPSKRVAPESRRGRGLRPASVPPRSGAVVRAVKPRGIGRVWPAPLRPQPLGRGVPFLAGCTIGLLYPPYQGCLRLGDRAAPAWRPASHASGVGADGKAAPGRDPTVRSGGMLVECAHHIERQGSNPARWAPCCVASGCILAPDELAATARGGRAVST